MAGARRNTISYTDARIVLAVAALAGVLAALSGAEPTGTTVLDMLFLLAFGVLAGWAGASAPWWALMGSAGITVLGALGGPLLLVALALAATAAAAWIGATRANQPVLRAAIAGAIVQVALRFEWSPFFLASALVAGLAIGLVVVAGIMRKRAYVRKRVLWSALGIVAFVGIAGIAFGAAAFPSRQAVTDGYRGMLAGLDFLQSGRVEDAQGRLQEAADDLRAAADDFGSPPTQLARLVPVLAQNRNSAAEVLDRAADAAGAAAETLGVVDLDRLTVENGVVDVAALADLEQPLLDLERTVTELSDALGDADSPWLIPGVASRIDEGRHRADQAAHQARATAAAARVGPALLGVEGERRYFVAFVNAAEARGTGGLMGNWTELTITNGRLEVTAEGRTARLQEEALRALRMEAPDDYFTRYAQFGARVGEGGVALKFWSNVTMPADMPRVGNAMAQMYEAATGTEVDGVFVIDAAGIAGLLEITGSIQLDDIDVRLDSGNAEEFLTVGQYEFAENEREDLLAAVTEQTVDNVLDETLPAPQRMAPALAPSVLNGHISAWAVRPEEQELFELVGMDGSLPVIATSGRDAIAVVTHNAGGNKIDSFLERTIEYRPRVNERTGRTDATLTISLTNTAPTSGFPDYVIGNLVDDLPTGTNRMLLDVYTRLGVDGGRLDGEDITVGTLPELGYYVLTRQIDVPPGETVVLELDLSGTLGKGPYALAYRPQALPTTDRLVVDARTRAGNRIFTYDGAPERRSLLDRGGIEAWRPEF